MNKYVRLMTLAIIAASVPACGSGGGGDEGGGDSAGGSGILFFEDFSGPFPIPDWVITNAAPQGSATIDMAAGSPPPCLLISQPTGPTGNLSVATKATYGSPSLTVSAQMAFGGTAGVGAGTANITIADPVTATTTASVVYNVAGNTIAFNITGTASAPVPDPGGFPAYTFSVDAAGTATWSLNNSATPIMTKAGFPAGNLRLTLNNSSNTTFRFDNVRVSAP